MIFVLLVVTVVVIVAEHYFPHWHEWVGEKLPAPKRLMVNYAAGTLAWAGPFFVWLWMEYGFLPAVIGCVFLGAAGATTWGTYRYDASVERRRKEQEKEEEMSLLREQVKELRDAAGKRTGQG